MKGRSEHKSKRNSQARANRLATVEDFRRYARARKNQWLPTLGELLAALELRANHPEQFKRSRRFRRLREFFDFFETCNKMLELRRRVIDSVSGRRGPKPKEKTENILRLLNEGYSQREIARKVYPDEPLERAYPRVRACVADFRKKLKKLNLPRR